VSKLPKIFLSQPEESRSIKLGISADAVVRVGVKRLTGFILPNLFCLVFSPDVNRVWIPIVLFAWDVVASFKEQDSFAQSCEGVGERPSASASANNDDIELSFSFQICLPKPEMGLFPLLLLFPPHALSLFGPPQVPLDHELTHR